MKGLMEQANFNEVKNAVLVNLLVKDLIGMMERVGTTSDPDISRMIYKSVSLELAVLEDIYCESNRFVDGFVHNTVRCLLDNQVSSDGFYVQGNGVEN